MKLERRGSRTGGCSWSHLTHASPGRQVPLTFEVPATLLGAWPHEDDRQSGTGAGGEGARDGALSSFFRL